ncbi:monocarboxylate transporter 6-like isoform X2 [Haemaphysalis longicornis]
MPQNRSLEHSTSGTASAYSYWGRQPRVIWVLLFSTVRQENIPAWNMVDPEKGRNPNATHAEAPDGAGEEWHVTVVAAAAYFFGSASIRSSGVIYVSIINELGVNRASAAWPDTLIDATSEMAGLLMAVYFERINTLTVMKIGSVLAWFGVMTASLTSDVVWMSLTLGVTHGLGIGLVFGALQVYLSQHSCKYRGTAHGIMYAGAAASAIVFPYLLEYTTQLFGFRLCLLIFGLLLVNLTVITFLLDKKTWIKGAQQRQAVRGSLYKPDAGSGTAVISSSGCSQGTATISASRTDVILREGRVFRCPMYYVILITWVVFNYCFDVFLGVIDDYASDKQMSFLRTISIIPIISSTDIFGGVCLPALVDKGLVTRSALLSITYVGLGVTMAVLPLTTEFPPFVGVCLVFSMFMGCGNAMYGVLQADYIRKDRLPVSYGVAGFVAGLLLIGKPFVIGYFRDGQKSYDGLFKQLSVLLFLLGIAWLVVALYEWHASDSWKRRRRRQAVIAVLRNL